MKPTRRVVAFFVIIAGLVAGSLAPPAPLAYAESRAVPARSPAPAAVGQPALAAPISTPERELAAPCRIWKAPRNPGQAAARLACQFPGQVAVDWLTLQLKLTKETPGFSPPVAARAFGYAGVALYESVVGGMPSSRSLVGQLNGLAWLPQPEPGRIYWGSAANAALAEMLRSLYPTASPQNLAAVDALEAGYAAQFRAEAGAPLHDLSAAYGLSVAQAVFAWSATDGGHEGYLHNYPGDYTPPVGPGLWEPTPPGYLPALQPYWGANRPLVFQSGQECAPPPPPAYSADPASQFYAEAWEVYGTSLSLTPEQVEIALFWADNAGETFTPPGHSVSIATQVLHERGASLALAAETYARVGLAVSDAFVGCWSAKFAHNLLRPVTYIRAEIDPAWEPLLVTPPFPEYTSGHSVQLGAAAAVLTRLFGDNYQFTDLSHQDRGLPARSFGSFAEAAQEAAMSRLYGGIHYRAAIEQGLAQGECIGARVNALAWRR